MPIFEYRCLDCSHIFEELIRNQSQASSIICPQCYSSQIEKLMSLFGFSSDSGTIRSSPTGTTSCRTCTSRNCASCR